MFKICAKYQIININFYWKSSTLIMNLNNLRNFLSFSMNLWKLVILRVLLVWISYLDNKDIGSKDAPREIPGIACSSMGAKYPFYSGRWLWKYLLCGILWLFMQVALIYLLIHLPYSKGINCWKFGCSKFEWTLKTKLKSISNENEYSKVDDDFIND